MDGIDIDQPVITEQGPRQPHLRRIVAFAVAFALFGGMAAAIVLQQRKIEQLESARGGCAQVERQFEELTDTIGQIAADKQEAKRMGVLTVANLVLQNPSCFDAKMRAGMQTYKEGVERQAASDAMGQAARDAIECAKPVAFWC